jgi:hypothetical protein
MAATTQLMACLASLLLGNDDDRKREFSAGEWAAALIAGPINGLFVAGDMLNMVVRRALSLRVFGTNSGFLKVGDDAFQAGKNIDHLFSGDSEKMLKELHRLSGSVGNILSLFFGPAAQAPDVILGNPMKDLEKAVGL